MEQPNYVVEAIKGCQYIYNKEQSRKAETRHEALKSKDKGWPDGTKS